MTGKIEGSKSMITPIYLLMFIELSKLIVDIGSDKLKYIKDCSIKIKNYNIVISKQSCETVLIFPRWVGIVTTSSFSNTPLKTISIEIEYCIA